MPDALNQFVDYLLLASASKAKEAILHLSEVSSAEEVVETFLAPALDRIGEKWELGQISLSQVYMSGRICEEIVNTIFPPKESSSSPHMPVAVAVLEDYHMLGKKILYSTLIAYGVNVRDFGRVTVEEAVSQVAQHNIKVLLVSTLMLPSALRVKELQTKLRGKGLAVTVIVGGAPFRFDKELWREVGADYMAETASEGARMVLGLLEELSCNIP
ncbi:MAG: cobalamin-binding protein [Acidobacteria bacterium]|nr:MAG: cobalamin-binding protein [Acidobacteriota bacterium]